MQLVVAMIQLQNCSFGVTQQSSFTQCVLTNLFFEIKLVFEVSVLSSFKISIALTKKVRYTYVNNYLDIIDMIMIHYKNIKISSLE
jgi:hypothetical protein